jgi:hypothetical protein
VTCLHARCGGARARPTTARGPARRLAVARDRVGTQWHACGFAAVEEEPCPHVEGQRAPEFLSHVVATSAVQPERHERWPRWFGADRRAGLSSDGACSLDSMLAGLDGGLSPLDRMLALDVESYLVDNLLSVATR